jgi:hypothetical protein
MSSDGISDDSSAYTKELPTKHLSKMLIKKKKPRKKYEDGKKRDSAGRQTTIRDTDCLQ